MKIKALVISLLIAGVLAGQGWAKIGIGYDTLVILPHAFTLNLYDESSGWGVKASTDFGFSAVSLMARAAGSVVLRMFGLNTNFDSVYFTTLCLTKDFYQSEAHRAYVKLGAFTLTGSAGGSTQSASIIDAGVGGEWKNIIWQGVTGAIEAGYPEVLTLGLRYYF